MAAAQDSFPPALWVGGGVGGGPGLLANQLSSCPPMGYAHNDIVGSGSGSDRSLECLLSGGNSHTDTATSSGEDDGISVIFSGSCRRQNILSFSSPQPNPPPNPRKRGAQDGGGQGFRIITCDLGPQQAGTAAGGNNNNNNSNNNNNKKPKTNNNNNNNNNVSSNISFQQGASSGSSSLEQEPDAEAIQQMKEMIYRAAAFRPVDFGLEAADKPKRKNVRISSDPQTVAARQRRERISERLRVLQKIVPGGSKMDTASMLDEAANYLKFLRNQVKALEAFGNKLDHHHYVNFSPNNPTNLQFSPLPLIPMQAPPPPFTLQKP